MKRIFPAVKLRPQTPRIDKKETGDAAIPEERKIHTSLLGQAAIFMWKIFPLIYYNVYHV